MATSNKEFGHNQTIPKRIVYEWSTHNSPGRFEMLSKHSLFVDPIYQRDGSNSKAKSFAQEWNWVACSCICVNDRKDGTFAVIDGQHRVLAALKRDDIQELPCLVFSLESIAEEAKGFLDTNSGNRVPRMMEKFKAMKAMGDSASIELEELAHRHGLLISHESKPGTLGCIRLLMRWMDTEKGKATVYRMFPLICELCEGQIFHAKLVEGLLTLETKIFPEKTLTAPLYKKRVLAAGYSELLRGCHGAAALHARGGGKVFAQGILATINKRCQNKLEVAL